MTTPTSAPPSRIVVEETVTTGIDNITDYLVAKTGLPKGRVKHALTCGALRIKKIRGGFQRVRRATATTAAGSTLLFHYDEHLLALKPPPTELLLDLQQYSIWFKPPGVLSQGTEWGDHCSMLRMAELHFDSKRQVFLVHRLDRDACGLMMVAHSGQLADKLGHLFSSRAMEKTYRVRVKGLLTEKSGLIQLPLDRKEALSRFRVIDEAEDSSLLEVTIETGRKHQIRRHLSAMGHPVLGDTLYGESDPSGLHLCAIHLRYQCPVQGREITVDLEPQRIVKYWR